MEVNIEDAGFCHKMLIGAAGEAIPPRERPHSAERPPLTPDQSERVSAELNAFRHENAKLRDEIDMVERVEREKLAALVQVYG